MGILNWKWYGKNDMGTQLKIWISLIEKKVGLRSIDFFLWISNSIKVVQ